MDLILRNLRLRAGETTVLADIGIAGGRIAAVEPGLGAATPEAPETPGIPGTPETQELDLGGRFVVPGFVESHIHLDKACILERCAAEEGSLREAIVEVAKAKRAFTVADIRARAIETLERCILQGTTRMRSHIEVDPAIGMKGIEAVLPLIDEYRWAIDLEICVFPQEGLLDNPGTDALMVEALRRGARVVGGCPYTDSDPEGQIDRVFEMAREFDVDIDFHLDFDTNPEGMTLGHVCDLTARFGWGGRVAIGHVSKLSALPAARLGEAAARLADAGVAVTVLPSTDLYLMGGARDHDVVRGVAPVHRLIEAGVNCALSTNNLLNPFTPFGDGSLIRMANLYANIARLGTGAGIRECLSMVTERPARLMRHADYGIAAGHPADLVVLDCESAEAAVRTLAAPLMGFKNGRRTFTRSPAQLHRP